MGQEYRENLFSGHTSSILHGELVDAHSLWAPKSGMCLSRRLCGLLYDVSQTCTIEWRKKAKGNHMPPMTCVQYGKLCTLLTWTYYWGSDSVSSCLQPATYSLMDFLPHRAGALVSTCRNRGSKGGLIDWNLGGCAMGFFSIGSGFFEDKSWRKTLNDAKVGICQPNR